VNICGPRLRRLDLFTYIENQHCLRYWRQLKNLDVFSLRIGLLNSASVSADMNPVFEILSNIPKSITTFNLSLDFIQLTNSEINKLGETLKDSFQIQHLALRIVYTDNVPFQEIFLIPSLLPHLQSFQLSTTETDIIPLYRIQRQNPGDKFRITELSLFWSEWAREQFSKEGINFLYKENGVENFSVHYDPIETDPQELIKQLDQWKIRSYLTALDLIVDAPHDVQLLNESVTELLRSSNLIKEVSLNVDRGSEEEGYLNIDFSDTFDCLLLKTNLRKLQVSIENLHFKGQMPRVGQLTQLTELGLSLNLASLEFNLGFELALAIEKLVNLQSLTLNIGNLSLSDWVFVINSLKCLKKLDNLTITLKDTISSENNQAFSEFLQRLSRKLGALYWLKRVELTIESSKFFVPLNMENGVISVVQSLKKIVNLAELRLSLIGFSMEEMFCAKVLHDMTKLRKMSFYGKIGESKKIQAYCKVHRVGCDFRGGYCSLWK